MLGDHVAQKGSLVAPDRLRFDFSHPKPMSADEIERVEDIANDVVLQNSPVTTRLMAVDDAIASGARALFGEKYGDEVRVVAMGEGGNTMGWSVELCGGTHVRRTGDIGLISVVAEGGVAAGRAAHRGAHRPGGAQGTRTHLTQLAKAAAVGAQGAAGGHAGSGSSRCSTTKKRLERDLAEARKKLAMGRRRRRQGGRRRAQGRRRQAAGARGRRASRSRI